jgi:DNA-binding GntR family transcriptional regulator
LSPRRRDQAPGPTAVAALTDELRTRILDGTPAPGTPLREEELAKEKGVSRHTVRAALAALAAERLVDVVPYRGARVAELDDAALVALQELRGALEAEAVRLLSETHGERWPRTVTAPIATALQELADADQAQDWPRTTRAHAAFHRAIVAAAQSARITQAQAQLDGEVLLMLTHARPHYPKGALARDHRDYLAAIQRDGGEAVRAHLASSTNLIRSARAAQSGRP